MSRIHTPQGGAQERHEKARRIAEPDICHKCRCVPCECVSRLFTQTVKPKTDTPRTDAEITRTARMSPMTAFLGMAELAAQLEKELQAK